MLEYETLSGDEIHQLLKGEKILRPDLSADAKKPVASSLPSRRKKGVDLTPEGIKDADKPAGDDDAARQ